MGFPENGLYHQSVHREDPMRHRHHTPHADLRQPGWDAWLADALGLTDYSDRAPRAALARCLLVAAALRVAVSAVTRRAAGLGRETVRKGIAAALPADPRALEARLAPASAAPSRRAGRGRSRSPSTGTAGRTTGTAGRPPG